MDENLRVMIAYDTFYVDLDELMGDRLGIIYATRNSGLADVVVASEDEMMNDGQYDKNGVTLALYMYSHSGTDLRVEGGPRRYWQHEAWDSGLIGWVHCSLERANEWFGQNWKRWTDERRATARKVMIEEVETMAQIQRGEIYLLILQERQGNGEWVNLEYSWPIVGLDRALEEASNYWPGVEVVDLFEDVIA